jgi:transcriptional regulator with XRE-family HTH domain
MLKEFFSKRLGKDIPEGPVEAGQTLGMSPEKVLEKYFFKRNNLLKLIRVYAGLSLADAAKRLEVSDKELDEIEKSDRMVPYQLVPRFSKLFNVDLKTLLILLGHAKGEVSDNKIREFRQLALAAQYSGPELRKQEKIDLEELFKAILEGMRAQKNKNSKGEGQE